MKSAFLLFFTLVSAIAHAETYHEIRNFEIPAAGVQIISIQSGEGSLKIKGTDSTDIIKVTAQIESMGTDQEEFQLLADKFVKLELSRKYDRAYLFSRAGPPPLTNIETRIHLSIQMPVRMNVRIIDGSGDIDISNIIGNLTIDDDSGAIKAGKVTGRILVMDSSGDIEIDEVQGRIEIVDGSGQIVIQHVTGDVTITDASGGIEVNDIGGSVTVSDGSGSIDIYRIRRNVFIREPGSGEIDIGGVQGQVTIRD